MASRYADHPFMAGRVRAAIESALEDAGATAGFLLCRPEGDGNHPAVCGALVAVAGPLTAAKATICNAPLFYVDPEDRKSDAGNLLLDAYLEWARSINAFDASVPVLSGHEDVARVGRWLERNGLHHIGDNFSKQL